MEIPFCRRPVVALVLLLLLAGVPSLWAKPIRLRHGTIDPTQSSPLKAQAIVASPPQSGLFLIQFNAPPTAEIRAQLATQGIDLLRYVPEDTFIARFQKVSVNQTRSLANVSFITPYLPEAKHDRRLLAAIQASKLTQPIRVRLVLAPRANPADVLALRRLLGRVYQQNNLKLTRVIAAEIQPAKLDALAQSPAVLWIEPDRSMRLHDEVSSKIVAGDDSPHVTSMQALGFDGSGVKVGVADSGLNNGDAATMHPDLFGRTPTFFFYGSLTDAADEHGHGTHVSGIIAGNGATGETDENNFLYGLGVAPGASIIAQRIFDGVGNYEAPPSYETLTRDATEAGAVVGSNSWGDDVQGQYDISAAEFDELVRDADLVKPGDQPYILEFSAGNAGPAAQTMDSPGVAKNVIATGACQSGREDLFIYDTGPDTMADFSSRGPCEDGRIKPDVVAPGTWISSLQSASATDENAWASISPNYQYEGGTSQAGPHASGAAAVFVQYYRSTHTNATPSPALTKAALINSATAMDPEVELAPPPNNDEGWGRVDLTELIGSDRKFDFVDQSVLLTNTQVYERRVVVGAADDILKITLAYTDVPGLPAVIPALVNDLDLEVISPDGHLYRGNQFSDGESQPDTANPDTINNIEAVHLSTPAVGEYIVRVRARHVVEDARQDTFAIDQDFALVISGDLVGAGQGIVVLDRHSYTAPSQINIRLIDSDLAGQPTAHVTVQSSTETNGENITLSASGSNGTFTCAVFTVTGPAAPDGKLQIAHGDLLQAIYADASGATNRIATAQADLVPPVLSGVGAASDFGSMIISWNSDEPSTSVVRYGTNTSLARAVINTTLTTTHTMALNGLVVGQTNYFAVISTDEAGNTATNDNGGTFFTLIAAPTAPVLVVDAAYDPEIGVPPLSGWTDPFNQLGVSYDVWDASQRGIPSTNTFGAYRAVFCRLPELVNSFTATQTGTLANNLSNYVSHGGSLFVATMEGLTRLEEVGAFSFITNVLHVKSHNVDTGVAQITGVGSDVVGAGLDTPLDYSAYEDAWSILLFLNPTVDLSDTMVPTADAAPALTDESGNCVALRWPKTGAPGPGRVIVCSFEFDTVPTDPSLVNNRALFLRNSLSFLIPGRNGLGTISLDNPSYSVPGTVLAEVDDSDLIGQSSTTVKAYGPHAPGGINVTLTSLGTNGVFTGTFNLVAATNAPADGRLPAADTDSIRVDYADASEHGTISATAIVDTTPPEISTVAAAPDYQDVVVSWQTDEPSDSLVQLGPSAFLDHTAYDPGLTTDHEVTIFGLLPDTAYNYRVVSTDGAGNTTTDDNSNALYTVRTLRPITTPWSDNLDTGATNWTTVDSADTQPGWALGVPNNSLATNAYSPPNCWGSNLKGNPIDTVETFLISPALFLTNGNVATLHFTHNYDFTPLSDNDILEQGQILILTNSVGSVNPIAVYSGDASGDWEQIDLDLTPHLGQVIYIVWQYDLLSFDTLARPGWLVDDISVTVETIVPGTVIITNNLWQAGWSLTGPVIRSGKGLGTTISNAPPGDYTLTWFGVPYYQTPAIQTNTLVSSGAATFNAAYTIVDTNHNGIPDSWEQQFFGAVETNRTAFTDTDGDGMSDYAEFIAGTDPTNPASVFRLSVTGLGPNNQAQLQWPYATGRAYQILGSTNGVTWPPISGWFQSTNQYNVPTQPKGIPYLFRIRVLP